MKVKIIEGCIACGTCYGICPEVFEENSDGFARVKNSRVSPEHELGVSDAAESCPVSVIVTE